MSILTYIKGLKALIFLFEGIGAVVLYIGFGDDIRGRYVPDPDHDKQKQLIDSFIGELEKKTDSIRYSLSLVKAIRISKQKTRTDTITQIKTLFLQAPEQVKEKLDTLRDEIPDLEEYLRLYDYPHLQENYEIPQTHPTPVSYTHLTLPTIYSV